MTALDAIEAVDVASWSRPYEETFVLARRLAARGTRLALLSNCPEPMAVAIDGMSWTDLIPRPVLQLPARARPSRTPPSTRRC